MTVNASARTAEELSGLVTRTSHACVPNAGSTWVSTVITMVVGFTTWVVTTCGAAPWPPSKTNTAPLTKPEPVRVRFTVEPSSAEFGVMLMMAG